MAKITLLPPEILADPEVVAMLQAFYSRSSMGIRERLEELGTDLPKVKDSLKKYFIGYGHDSIGDCGNVAVFFEGVSILFAKALQDNPLYNGQETSTRFFDYCGAEMAYPDLYTNGGGIEFADQAIAWTNEEEKQTCKAIQDSWSEFYSARLPTVIRLLEYALPHSGYPEIEEPVWRASIKARAFDIMRAFLPAGTLTQLSFYGSLRNLRDSLSLLQFHPLPEIAREAEAALANLSKIYPSSFANEKFTYGQARFIGEHDTDLFYNTTTSFLKGLDSYSRERGDSHDPLPLRKAVLKWKAILDTNTTRIEPSNSDPIPLFIKDILYRRPKGMKVPFHFGKFGQYSFKFFLDYGAFRDIQRHRNCKIPLPILTSDYGMHPWHLDQLKDLNINIYTEAINLIEFNAEKLSKVPVDSVEKMIALQYMHPMGMLVPVEIDLALDEMFYIAELRSSKTVHPTLRPIALELGRYLRDTLEVPVYLDESEDQFVPSRGRQTITKVDSDA